MPKIINDTRPRYYNSVSGNYNLKYSGEVYSRTYKLHLANLQKLYDRLAPPAGVLTDFTT